MYLLRLLFVTKTLVFLLLQSSPFSFLPAAKPLGHRMVGVVFAVGVGGLV